MMKRILFLLALMVAVSPGHSITMSNAKTEIMKGDILNMVRRNDLPGVSKALENGADVNTVDDSKRSLLLIATSNQQTEMARLLIRHVADVSHDADNRASPFL